MESKGQSGTSEDVRNYTLNYTLQDAIRFNNKGIEYYSQGKLEKAFAEYHKALAIVEYRKALTIRERLAPKLQLRQGATEEKVDVLDGRVGVIETRMDMLEGRVHNLEDSMNIINASIVDIERRRREEKEKDSPNQRVLGELAIERRRVERREAHILEFNRDPDLRHYYTSLLSEIEAMYIAAQAVASGRIAQNKFKAGKYLGNVASIIPIVGNLASQVISGVGSVAFMSQNLNIRRHLQRIRDVAPTIEEFDKIALRVAVDMTLANRDSILSLKGAEIPSNWRSKLRSVAQDMKQKVTKFVEDNRTQAKLLGRAHGHMVIDYLQQEAVAENLQYVEPSPEDARTYRRRESIIAREIGRGAMTM